MSVVGPFPTFRPDDLGIWSPSSESTLLGWWKADSLSLSNNDPVSSWSDSSASGYTMTQAGAARPIYKTNIKNGLPAVLFTAASGQYFTSSMPSNTRPMTVAAVISSNSQFLNAILATTATGDLEFYTVLNAHLDIGNQGVGAIAAVDTTISNGSWYVAIAQYDGVGNYTLMANLISNSGTVNSPFTGGGTTYMGVEAGVQNFWDGYIGEIFKFSSVVSTATIDTYLNGRWAVH